ncbi:MAG: tetratricopeptide repeat protein [Fibrobacterota bacterium]
MVKGADSARGASKDLEKLTSFWNNNRNMIIIAAAIVAVAAVSVLSYRYTAEQKRLAHKQQYLQALESDSAMIVQNLTAVHNASEGSYAYLSALKLGQIYMEDSRYDSAMHWFETAAEGNRFKEISDMAHENTGAVYEAMDSLDRAMDVYQDLTGARESFRSAAVYLKMAYLELSRGNAEAAERFCNTLLAMDRVDPVTEGKARGLLAELSYSRSDG